MVQRVVRWPFLVLVALALAPPGRATDVPARCRPGTLERATLDVAQGRARAIARLALPPGFDPAVAGLTIRVSGAPEADPANDLLEATLPPGSGWQRQGRRFVYRSATSGAAGVAQLALRIDRTGRARLVFDAVGLAPRPTVPGRLHVAVAAASGCARTCAAVCRTRGTRAICRQSPDTALCGVMSGCEPLGARAGETPGHCLVPYPSNAFTAADPPAATGLRVAYPRRAMPANRDGVHVDPTAWRTLDGFSPGPLVTAHFPQGVDLAVSRVPPLGDPTASVAPDSPTLLIEADAPGCVRVPHFGENDVSQRPDGGAVQPPTQAFLIRPQRRLRNATRYVVALRGLVGQDGRPIRAPEGFARARRRGRTGSAVLDGQRERVRAVLQKLERDCGVARQGVLLAWDFTTASDERLQRWLLHMRDTTLGALGDGAPPFAVTSVEEDPFGDPRICRRVRGTFTVPLWTRGDGPGTRLAIDPATDLPVQTGVTNAPFTALIPCSLVGPPARAGRVIVYGHGLLGGGDSELEGGRDLRRLADTHRFVLVATDWQGMARADIATLAGFLPELSGFPVLPERLHQGILNQLVLARLARAADGLAAAPALRDAGGAPFADRTQVFFYGNSMGGIYGGTFMALSQDITRGVLGVGSANFSTLLQRSNAFGLYGTLIRPAYPDDLERAMGYPVVQQLWDRVDPNGWYHRILENPLPDTPVHTVLLHLGTNDAEVPPLGLEIMARSLGVPQLAPVVRSRWDVAEVQAPWAGSALVESDGGYPPSPLTNTAPPPNGGHEGLRALPAMQSQIDAFLRPDGRVEQFCAGPCDPE